MPAATAGSSGALASGGGGGSSGSAGSAGMPDAADGFSEGCGDRDARTGTYETQVMSGGRARTYTLTAPETYDANTPHRVVIGLHGRDWDGTRMRQYLNLERYSDGQVIFVYPWAEKNGDYIGWKLGPFANRFGGDDDLVFFDDMLTALKKSYCVDATRVFVTGQSWGGDMTQLLTCMRGTALRAGVAVAANGTYYLPPSAGMCSGNAEIFTLHGVDDGDIPFSQGEALRDFWVREHTCGMQSQATSPDDCIEAVGCKARSVFCAYGPGNGGHQIPSWYSKSTMDWFLAY
jgi:poly(3-hydroxybutyrate) depolymerase